MRTLHGQPEAVMNTRSPVVASRTRAVNADVDAIEVLQRFKVSSCPIHGVLKIVS